MQPRSAKENYPNLITMKTIQLKTYLEEMIIYIHPKNEIKERKTKTNPESLTDADPAAPLPQAPPPQLSLNRLFETI